MEQKTQPKMQLVGDRPPDPEEKGILRPGRLVQQLRQRKVCRATITYVLVLWLNLQIADVLFPVIGIPDWTIKFVMIIGVMGFPVVLILAWTFQITPKGIELDLQAPEQSRVDRQLDRVVSVLLLLLSFALTVLILLQFMVAR
jgi:hypothetical protein